MKAVIISALCVAFFSHHVYNMAFVRFDYGHNMKVMMVMMMMMMMKMEGEDLHGHLRV